jgi:hypothetical protein
MRATRRQTEAVRAYVEDQAHEQVIHLEKAASELVGPVRHDIWDVHCRDSRWWVITEPTNIYSQEDFKSRDVALTFHIGLSMRMSYLHDRRIPDDIPAADLLSGSWRRWEQAFEAYDSGDEAENFQAVGVRLRECLISFIIETANDDLVPVGEVPPQGTNFRAWTELLANALASGESNAHLRSYLKKHAVETWEYVNWLTHAKNAIRPDADIGLKAVEHLLQVFTAARIRLRYPGTRCVECGSYHLVGGTCEHCGWVDQDYEAPDVTPKKKTRRTRRPKGECTPTSDILTFIRPEDVVG